MIILLSPAKTMDMSELDGQEELESSTPEFLEDMEVVLKIMQKKSTKQLATLFKSNDKIAKENHDRYTNWDQQSEKQAGFAFTGQAYKPLNFPSLEPDAQQFAQKHWRILCGLYGLLKPMDLIKAYRLEMGSNLETPDGDLYDFWKDKITKQLKKELEEFPEDERFVVNLASKEYYDAVDLKDLEVPVYNINFRGATVHIKQARGAMTRYILENQIVDPKQLKNFEEGWEYDDENSQETEFEFVKAGAKKQPNKRKQKNNDDENETSNKRTRTSKKK
eukprot:TRINITY_DN2574_c2_g1_i1.p1 TRINITY_DN2574_c2_g1~~TRINITY_DN2574_c2_g1_i1.p1  ORF type:complete len:305 (+),score=45.11 TRINITY_DN2574_c2_g1_i1:87-917(+)